MSRFIAVAPGSSEAATLATDELAHILGIATADALTGMTTAGAVPRPVPALPTVVEVVRVVGDDALITPARRASNHAFDHVAWNLNPAASTRAGVILVFDAEGASAGLLIEEIVAARLRAEAAAASAVAVVLTGDASAVEADVPVLNLPLGGEAAATLRATAAPTTATSLVFQAGLTERARVKCKRIVLSELDNDRVLQAAVQVLTADIADIMFVGDADYVARRVGKLGFDLSAAQVTSVSGPAYLECYAEEFAHLRAKKDVALEQTREEVTDVSYFGTTMIHTGDADSIVSDATHTTAYTIVPSFQITKIAPGVSVVSSIFPMAVKDHVWVLGDCAVNPNPTAEQLADIAVTPACTAAQLGVTPRVAMLSHSTGTSGPGPDVDVVVEAAHLARGKAPKLTIEGPIQPDAAVDAVVTATKPPGSEAVGKATIFVFPPLEVGNIGYKTVQCSSSVIVIGPVLQGPSKPVNDLLRGALIEDIVNIVALTAVQAQG